MSRYTTSSTKPTDFLLKMGTYVVNVNGCDLKVRVADHAETLIEGISELIMELRGSPSKIVGMSTYCRGSYDLPLLQLCVDSRCLVVILSRIRPLPPNLTDFLDESSTFFVGFNMDLYSVSSGWFSSGYDHKFLRGMDVRELAGKVLKKPDLLQKKLFKEVAAEVGISFDDCDDRAVFKALSSTKLVFSMEELKCIVRYPHATYLMGKKLLDIVP